VKTVPVSKFNFDRSVRKDVVSHPHQPPSEPVFDITLLTHTGAVILWHQQTRRHVGSLAQCERLYRSAQTHCLVAGWWSLLSVLVFNWIALFSNMAAIRRVRNLSKDPRAVAALQEAIHQAHQRSVTPPGWYPDPSGHPRQRYWDGGTWTNHTHPPSQG
jgi:hypothetical protein